MEPAKSDPVQSQQGSIEVKHASALFIEVCLKKEF